MKYRDLTDHIEGSILKKQYLEAFLVQSAYIESLLKLYTDYTFFCATSDVDKEKHKIIKTITDNLEKTSFNDLVNILSNSEAISKHQVTSLHKYRKQRNNMMHHLIQEIRKSEFETEIAEICKLGKELIESDEFKKMAGVVDYVEEGVIKHQSENDIKI